MDLIRVRAKRIVLACDIVVGHETSILRAASDERTNTLLNTSFVSTGAFVRENDIRYDHAGMLQRLKAASRSLEDVEAGRLAVRYFGDSIFAGIILLGVAYQRGFLPLSGDAIERAIELNGTAVADNSAAFRLGRRQAINSDPCRPTTFEAPASDIDTLIARRADELTLYQNEAYARRYRDFLTRVRSRERAVMGERTTLSVSVARGLFKLMAYKDEYEVARLYSSGEFARGILQQFGPDATLRFHMAPPILGRRDPDTGLAVKSSFGPWLMPVLRLLAHFKFLRGTACDPFGYSAERRIERVLIDEYQAGLARLLDHLSEETYASVVEYARVAVAIRGYGHVKGRAVTAARARFAEIETGVSS